MFQIIHFLLFDEINIKQVGCIVYELLQMMNDEATEIFLQKIIKILPNICHKIHTLLEKIKNNPTDAKTEEALKLMLPLLLNIFSSKNFEIVTNKNLLHGSYLNIQSFYLNYLNVT